MFDNNYPLETPEPVNVKNSTVTLRDSENNDIPIVQKLKYCYHNRIPFDSRKGLKEIYTSIERTPMSQDEAKKIKDWYVSVNMEPYKSGEYPVPSTFFYYTCLDQVVFDDDCCAFTLERDKSIFNNSAEEKEYAQALELYMKKHYHGSDEEKEDLNKKKRFNAEQYKKNIEAVKDEIEYLNNNLELELPNGCEIVNKSSYVGLQLNTYHAYIDALKNGLYDMFNNKTVKYGVEYKIESAYLHGWDFNNDDPYNQAIGSIKVLFNDIENYDGNIDLVLMETLKSNIKERVDNLLMHYMNKITVRENEKIFMKQMVENFFGTKGIIVETIISEPVVIKPRIFSNYSDYKETDFDS